MLIERNSRESKALDFVRFPLATLIVLLHTGVTCGPENIAYYICNYISAPIVVSAVPTFYFISGYLFFVGKDNFSFSTYKVSLRKKAKSLLIPYLIWNIIAYVLSIAYNYLKYHSIGDVMPWELYRIFFANGEGILSTSVIGYSYPVIVSPSAGVLWFMRDLMMMMLCSVVICFVVRKIKWLVFPILLLVNILGLGIPFPGFSLVAITFFTMGGFFSINNINLFKCIQYKNIVFVVWPILLVIYIIIAICSFEAKGFNIVYLTFSIAFVLSVAYRCVDKCNSYVGEHILRLGETSFFIYTFGNTLILWLINKEIGYNFNSIPYFGPLLNYIFSFSITVVECVVVFYMFKCYCPRVLSVLIGGRLK